MRAKKWMLGSSLAVLAGFLVFSWYSGAAYGRLLAAQVSEPTLDLQHYDFSQYLPRMDITILPDEGVMIWDGAGSVTLDVYAEAAGVYHLYLTYLPMGETYESVYLHVDADGTRLADNIYLPPRFVFTERIRQNGRGDDVYPEQTILREWMTEALRLGEDESSPRRLTLPLEAGAHTLVLTKNETPIWLGGVHLAAEQPLPAYADYRAKLPDAPLITEQIVVEAEDFSYKNVLLIALENHADAPATPYRTHTMALNSIAPKTFGLNNDRLAYIISVPQEGYYTLGLKMALPGKPAFPVYADIEIDGHIPFEAFRDIAFPYERLITNHVLWDTPVYLTAGAHEIALVINAERYARIIAMMRQIVDGVSDLSIAVQKLTGGVTDREREWVMADFMPDLVTDMQGWYDRLEETVGLLLEMTGGRSSQEINELRIAMKQLARLIQKPNELPFRLTALSQGTSSVLRMVSKSLMTIGRQSVNLDAVIIGADRDHLPLTGVNYAFFIAETAKQLFRSFGEDRQTRSQSEDPDTLTVWMKRSRQFADVLEQLIEDDFTPKTGINVNLSIFTQLDKLALANAADRQPDVALCIDSYYVNDLATRHALANLKAFPGSRETVGHAIPGALLQMMIDDELYGLPDNQDFLLMFYRTDIFGQYGWEPPDTWDDVLLMLPQLHRAGMNFYTHLSLKDAFKSWTATFPFIAQFHGQVYEDGYCGTVIGSDNTLRAINFMTELFMIYGLPKQVTLFANDFRAGTIPVGVSDFLAYIALMYTAPEIKGRWQAMPIPGVAYDGTVERWIPGRSTASAIFEASGKKDNAWVFMQWWLSTQTQRRYSEMMQSMYGPEYLWVSGNREVLTRLPVPRDVREVVAEQVQWIQETPKIPGGYYTERAVSDAFNRVVYQGIDIRSSVDDAVVVADREIKRKMAEFGYLDEAGNILKPYSIPTISKIEEWLARDD
jgi:ABC-type glycerol-3-phosphate transport system substrate-binding protein